LTTPIAHLESHDRARGGVHRQPPPWLVHLRLDNATHVVCLKVPSRDDHRLGRGDGLNIPMVG
jgi:hypothetical protein